MQPDQTRRPYPAFRAWLVRLLAYAATGMGVVVAAVVLLGRLLPAGVPPLLALAVQVVAGFALGAVVNHVVLTVLHDHREAAGRELAADLAEYQRRLHGRGDDGAA
jgi:hypothetical protein